MAKQKQTKGEAARIPANAKLAFTIPEFCELHSMSRAHFYRLIERGEGPEIMKSGGKTLISIEAAKAWRKRTTAKTQRERTTKKAQTARAATQQINAQQ